MDNVVDPSEAAREPGHGTNVTFDPLCQKGSLAVAGGAATRVKSAPRLRLRGSRSRGRLEALVSIPDRYTMIGPLWCFPRPQASSRL